jgi:hypothetical protein
VFIIVVVCAHRARVVRACGSEFRIFHQHLGLQVFDIRGRRKCSLSPPPVAGQ